MPLAVVTGAGQRLGAAIARALAAEGYDLALHAHASRAGADAVAADARALGRAATVHGADLSTDAGVDALGASLRAAHPVVDLVVHNAGVFEHVAFDAIDRAAYRRMQAINVEAPFFLTQGLLPSLRASASASVVLLADIAAERAMSGYAHYTVSKAGVVALMKALAVELAPIRVNAVAPGAVLLPSSFDAAARKQALARVPLQREGAASDVAGAVVYLAGAPYVSGALLAVDGGRSARI